MPKSAAPVNRGSRACYLLGRTVEQRDAAPEEATMRFGFLFILTLCAALIAQQQARAELNRPVEHDMSAVEVHFDRVLGRESAL